MNMQSVKWERSYYESKYFVGLNVAAIDSAIDKHSNAANNILRILRHIFYFDEEFKRDIVDIEYVDATIPILKIHTVDGLEIDLSSCTEKFVSGLHNSFLIRGFAM
uniref:Uncharacterized protein n=1 Tax=Heterorhabditis bacteriophora TaxID=37862 RepID=A0A1I7XHW1_HETBA